MARLVTDFLYLACILPLKAYRKGSPVAILLADIPAGDLGSTEARRVIQVTAPLLF
jgi:hypothetical protein